MSESIRSDASRLPVLDGWRGLSILFVLAGHLFPLGPKAWAMNAAVASLGMAIFFTLSGFLITTFLLRNDNVRTFLVRRGARILPLAWAYMAVVMVLTQQDGPSTLAHFMFYANVPPFWLIDSTAHLWSLCVEVHFYLGVALLIGLFGGRALMCLPLLALAVTGLRIATGTELSIVTWLRVDEILAGATLALIHHRRLRIPGMDRLWRVNPLVFAGLGLACSHPGASVLNYLRPYVVALAVGSTLAHSRPRITALLTSRSMAYVAKISYALYVLHPGLAHTWLGSGDTLLKYLKRPLLMAALWFGAHVSTHYFEARFIELGHRFVPGRERRLA